jgi:hypothetical protein
MLTSTAMYKLSDDFAYLRENESIYRDEVQADDVSPVM